MLVLTMLVQILSVMVIYGCWTLCDGTNIYVTAVDGVHDDLDITQYVAFPANNKYLKFQLKACRDGNLFLYSRSDTGNPYYYIIIGGWGGYRSNLRRNHNDELLDMFEGYGQVDCSTYKEFWISWDSGKIQIGKGNVLDVDVFMSYEESCPFDINRITIGTSQAATVYWILYPTLDVNASQQDLALGTIFTESSECPTFEIITTIPTLIKSKCAFTCTKNENCKGFSFFTDTGLCQMVSGYAQNTVLTSYYVIKR